MSRRWTTNDDEGLMDRFTNGEDFAAISNNIRRSELATKLRVGKIMSAMLEKGHDTYEISITYQRPEDEIKSIIKYYKNYNEKHKKPEGDQVIKMLERILKKLDA